MLSLPIFINKKKERRGGGCKYNGGQSGTAEG
jgi:hypothetical protein